MLLRMRGPDGMARLTVEPTTTFGDLGKQVRASIHYYAHSQLTLLQLLQQLPKTVDPKTITLSNAPNGGDSKRLGDIISFKVSQIGLKYGAVRRALQA